MDTAILIRTAHASYIWDCAAFLSLPLIGYLSTLDPPLKAIAISHPHVRSSFPYPSLLIYSSDPDTGSANEDIWAWAVLRHLVDVGASAQSPAVSVSR